MGKLSDDARQSLQGLLTKATAAPDEYAKLPDGDYGCSIESVTLTTTKETGQPMLSWVFRVEDEGDFEGRLIFKNSVFNSVQNAKRAQKDLAKFGVDTTSVEAIMDALPDLEGEVLIVQLTPDRNGESQWVNLLVE